MRCASPADYAGGHLDHGYAITAHRAQGATVDRTFVLGSDEAFRECGYTAMSRHRDGATFYLTAPTPYLNRPAIPIEEKNELAETVARTFEDSHRQELALEAVERDPHACAMLEELDRAQRRTTENEQRLDALRDQREHTPWWRRAERHKLDVFIESNAHGAQTANARVDELRDRFDRHLDEPPEPAIAPRAREPLVRYVPIERAPGLDMPDHGMDMGM